MLMLHGNSYLCTKLYIIVVSHLNKVWTSQLPGIPNDSARVNLLDTFNGFRAVSANGIRNYAHVSWLTRPHERIRLTSPYYTALALSLIADKVRKNWSNAGAGGDDDNLIEDLRHVKDTGDWYTSYPIIRPWGVDSVYID